MQKKSEFPILKPEERPVGSPNPNPASHDIPPGPTKGSSALPYPDSSRNSVIGAEPGMAEVMSGHQPLSVREALFKTFRKDVHRG